MKEINKLYKMLECSNQDSVGYRYLNDTQVLNIGYCFKFGNLYSSCINKIDYVDNRVIIDTLNTHYEFEEIKGE